MAKHPVFLIHGMGTFAKPTGEKPLGWAQAWVDALVQAAKQFSVFAQPGKGLLDRVRFIPLTYDDKISQYWEADPFKKQWGDNKALFAFLDADVRNVFQQYAESDQTSFFWTHWADVLIWRFAPEIRRMLIASLIQSALEANANGDCSILAHSLGTSVVHGVLAGMKKEKKGWRPGTTVVRYLGLVSCVAEVLAHDEAPPYVPPLGKGLPDNFAEKLFHIHHRLDPFTWFKRYDAEKAGGLSLRIGEIPKGLDLTTIHDFETAIAHPRAAYGILSGIVQNLSTDERFDMVAEERALEEKWRAAAALTDDDIDQLSLQKVVGGIADYFGLVDKYLRDGIHL